MAKNGCSLPPRRDFFPAPPTRLDSSSDPIRSSSSPSPPAPAPSPPSRLGAKLSTRFSLAAAASLAAEWAGVDNKDADDDIDVAVSP